jgi:ParB family chromosome partitioning protein
MSTNDYSNSNINGTNNTDNGGLGKGLQSLIPNKMNPSVNSGQAPSASSGQAPSGNLGQVPFGGLKMSQNVPLDPPSTRVDPTISNSYVPPILLEDDIDHNDKNDVEIKSANNVFDFSFIPSDILRASPSMDSEQDLSTNLEANLVKNIVGNESKKTLPQAEIKMSEISSESRENKTEQNSSVPLVTTINTNFAQPSDSENFSDIRGRIFQIEVDKIVPNTQQPRQEFNNESLWELASSIKEYGILEPLVVSRHEEETENGTKVHYQLISGERRLRASKLLGLKTVPVIIKESLDEKLKLELALIENIQREDLNSISKARAFTRLMSEFGLSQQAVATKMGKSREYVANILRLLQLPYEAQKAMEEGKINEGHARAILLLPNPEKRRALLGIILSKNISGREAEEIAKSYLSPEMLSQKTRGARMSASMDTSDLQLKELLENIFKTRVDFKKKGEQGEIAIKFYSKDELEAILKTLLATKEIVSEPPIANPIMTEKPENSTDLPEFGTV